MSTVAGFLSGPRQDVGEWQNKVLKRTTPPWPTDKELVALWRGAFKPRRCKAKLSPTQAAKKRWKRKRQRRFVRALRSREYFRRDTLGKMFKMIGDEPENTEFKLSWWEKTPLKTSPTE